MTNTQREMTEREIRQLFKLFRKFEGLRRDTEIVDGVQRSECIHSAEGSDILRCVWKWIKYYGEDVMGLEMK